MNFSVLTRNAVLVALALGIAWVYLFIGFSGLTSKDGMSKAQLGREVSRGYYKTKEIYPLSIGQFEKNKKRTPQLHEVSRADSFNAPLYPMLLGVVFKVADGGNFEKWQMSEKDTVYGLDRVVVGTSMAFFLLSVLMAYFLARSLFDSSIAAVTALLLLTTDLFWKFTHTGGAQSLMLFLFMGGGLCIYLATKNSVEDERNGFVFGVIGGVFLILLSMTHWMGLWILAGYLIYAFFFIRPVGGVALTVLVLTALAAAHPVLQNIKQTGHPFGTAVYTLNAGLGSDLDMMLRKGDTSAIFFNIKGVATSIASNFLLGFTRMFEYSGFIFAAPVFFLSLLHTFKRPAVATFRWAVLIIWIMASVGMAFYGYGEDAFFTRQIHFLFGPVMAIYGLAMIAVLWSRSPIVSEGLRWQSGYLWIVGAISVLPFLFDFPQTLIKASLNNIPKTTYPQTHAVSLNRTLHKMIPENQYIFADQPWAVAWYADRHAIWTPHQVEHLQKIEQIGENQGLPIAGIFYTPHSVGIESLFQSKAENGTLFPIPLNQWVYSSSNGKLPFDAMLGSNQDTLYTINKYPNVNSVLGAMMMYYSAEKVDISGDQEN